jgi:hypothetical protein
MWVLIYAGKNSHQWPSRIFFPKIVSLVGMEIAGNIRDITKGLILNDDRL